MDYRVASDVLTYCLQEADELVAQKHLRRYAADNCSMLFEGALRQPEIAFCIGRFVGMRVAKQLSAISQSHGCGVRATMRALHDGLLPEIYVCGGQDEWATVAGVHRFAVRRGVWESVPPMPTARSFCCSAAVGGVVYVFGGERDQRSAFAAAEGFDPAIGEWERLPPMPTARAGCAAAVVGGEIYVCGGLVVAWHVLDAVEIFNPSLRRWRRAPPMPTARCGCAAASCNNSLFVFGGQVADGEVLSSVEAYDPFRRIWRTLPPMPAGRTGCSATSLKGLVYVIGGLNVQGLCTFTIDRFDPSGDGSWLPAIDVLVARSGMAVAASGLKLFVAGGFGDDRRNSDRFESIDVDTGHRTLLPPLPFARRLCGGSALLL